MPAEFRVVGPPGTGKTTFLAHQVEQWATQHPPERMVLTSYTRAAAAVLAGRVGVPRENIATLHALCYRAIGRPPIAETGALAAQWDARPDLPPSWKLGASLSDLEEGNIADTDAGAMLADYNLWRAQLRTDPMLGERVRYFAEAWEAYKADTGSIDFADMLDRGYEDLPECPGLPEVLVVDEAQDLTPAQWRLIRQWGASRDLARYVVAGDPAQAIYGFAGARPDVFMTPVEPGHERLLMQSWRLPPAIHEYAEAYLAQHSPPMTDNRTFRPREGEPGEVRRIGATWRTPDAMLHDVDGQLRAGRTVMVLAACSYMLRPLLALLREQGIPFHNPYRRQAGAWNPLRPARDGQVSTVDRLLAYLRPDWRTWDAEARNWSVREALQWLDMLRASEFEGTKTAALAGGLPQGREVLPADLIGLLNDEALDALTAESAPAELGRRALQRYERPLEFAAAIYARRPAALRETPRLTIGTIHSVKGGESDVIYLFPDISLAGLIESRSADGQDAMIRQFYVGMTRARQSLVLCAPQQPGMVGIQV